MVLVRGQPKMTCVPLRISVRIMVMRSLEIRNAPLADLGVSLAYSVRHVFAQFAADYAHAFHEAG